MSTELVSVADFDAYMAVAWHCSCCQVWSLVPLDEWCWGEERHTRRHCTDYGEVILPPGRDN